MAEFIKKSEVRKLVKASGFRCSKDVFIGLNRVVNDKVVSAIGKAKSDRRITVRAEDVL